MSMRSGSKAHPPQQSRGRGRPGSTGTQPQAAPPPSPRWGSACCSLHCPPTRPELPATRPGLGHWQVQAASLRVSRPCSRPSVCLACQQQASMHGQWVGPVLAAGTLQQSMTGHASLRWWGDEVEMLRRLTLEPLFRRNSSVCRVVRAYRHASSPVPAHQLHLMGAGAVIGAAICSS